MLYMVNPRTRRRGGDGRFSLNPRTRTKKRKTGGSTMAKRKRKSTAKRRKSSTTRRRRRVSRTPAIQVKRRGRVVYNSNPRKRRRSRRGGYARNPRIVAQVKQVAMDTVMVAAGGAVQRVASKFLPTMSNPLLDAAKGTAVAVAVGLFGRKFLGGDRARFLAAGAMLPVVKNVVTAYMPSASAFLGDYEPLGTYSQIPGADLGDPYPDGGYLADGGMDAGQGVGSYQMGTY